MKRIAGLFTALVLSATGVSQGAMTFSVSGLAGTGVTADVTFSYASSSNTTGTITVAIENTSPAAVGGFVTGFAFNAPMMSGVAFTSIGGDAHGGGVTAIPSGSVSPSATGWYAKFALEDIKTPNDAGDFDFGVLNHNASGAFITGGNGSEPKIDIGETHTFTLAVVGTGLDDFTNAQFESAFAGAFSSDDPSGDYFFGVRFQGVATGGGSDLAVPTQMVPIPGAAVMAMMGLGGVFATRRRLA